MSKTINNDIWSGAKEVRNSASDNNNFVYRSLNGSEPTSFQHKKIYCHLALKITNMMKNEDYNEIMQ